MKKFFFFLTLTLIYGVESSSQTLYEDPQGNFIMNLYDDLEPQPQDNPDAYIFKQANYSLIMVHNTERKALDELFNETVGLIQSSGLKELETAAPVQKMMVNGLPAKRGEFTSDYTHDNMTLKLTGLALSYQLDSSGISAFLILNENNLKKSLDHINKTLYSLRKPGTEITGVMNIQEVEFDPSAVVTSSETEVSNEPAILEHDGLRISFPPGWTVKPKGRGEGEEIIGKFDNNSIYSGCLIMGLKGIIWNKKLALQTADEIGQESLPGGKLRKKEEIELANNKKGVLAIYDGTAVGDGEEIEMSVLTFTQKVGKYHLIYVGTGPTQSSGRVEKDILMAANSIE